MSCLPGMPCFGDHPNNPSAKTCGVDPCFTYKTTTDLVKYVGPNLPCIDVSTCETVTLALQKIDYALCGVNVSQTVINTIINNQYINQQFTTIVNDLIDCQTVQACMSSTTTTTACVCKTYNVINEDYNYPISTTFIDCEGNVTTTVVGSEPIVICACQGSIDPNSKLTFIPIANGCVEVPTIPPCGVFTNDKTSTNILYYYDPTTNTSIPLYLPGAFASEDIASTNTKIWLYKDSGADTLVYEWDIITTPFVAILNRIITVPGFNFGPGITAKNNTTLITTEDTTGDIYEIDITTNTGIPTFMFSMISGRYVTGDLLYTTTGKLIVTNNNLVNQYFTQYDYTSGLPEVDNSLAVPGATPTAIFEFDGNIYIGFCSLSDPLGASFIAKIDKNPP